MTEAIVGRPREVLADRILPARLEGRLLVDAGLVCAAVILIGLSARVRISLSFTPVPVSGQTLTVLLAGAALGSRRGGAVEQTDIQEAFIRNQGLQCGYCTPGMVLATKVFLDSNPDPTEDEIRHAISGNLCRCTGYHFIVESIQDAARQRVASAAAAEGSASIADTG